MADEKHGAVEVERDEEMSKQKRRLIISTIICSFLVQLPTSGSLDVYGVYLTQYLTSTFPNTKVFTLNFIGTIQVVFFDIAGLFMGGLADKYGARRVIGLGLFFCVCGYIAASFASQPWHLYLSQGLLFGVGSALYFPAVAAPAGFFGPRDRYRGLATGICAAGGSAGGLILSPVTQRLMSTVGLAWTFRATALIIGVVGYAALPGIRSPKSIVSTPVINLFLPRKILLSPNFLAHGMVVYCATVGYLVPIIYISDYAVVHSGLSAQQGADLVAIINGFACLGRALTGWMADTSLGAVTSLIICMAVSAASMVFFWMWIGASYAALIIFAIIYGIASAGYVSLIPLVGAQLYGVDRLASVTGWMYLFAAGGLLTGSLSQSHILDLYNGTNFKPMIIFAAVFVFASCAPAFYIWHSLRKSVVSSEKRSIVNESHQASRQE